MNILFLSTEIPFPLDHGHHLRTGNVLKCLAEDHAIHFVGFYKDEAELAYLPELRKYCDSVNVFPLQEGALRWRYFWGLLTNLLSSQPFPAQRYDLPAAQKQVRELIRTKNIDAVHFDAPWLAAYQSAVAPCPKILTTHNVEAERLRTWMRVEKNPLAKAYLYLQYRKLYRFEKNLYYQFEQNIVVSEKDRDELAKFAPDTPFAVVPNGVDTVFFTPNYDAMMPNRVVWAGPMNDPYNKDAVDYFLHDVYPLLSKKTSAVTVTFLGPSPTPYLQELAKNDHRLIAAGYVDDIRPYVDKATVFIAPLRAGGGTKLKVLNAMAQGKAVVTTSIGAEGISGVSPENIRIADTPQHYAEAICYLLAFPDEARAVGQKARELVLKYYDWQVIRQQMSGLYNAFVPHFRQHEFSTEKTL